MALEQTLNRDSKMRGGMIAFSLKPEAVKQWILTAHERSAITTAMKSRCVLNEDAATHGHKEAGPMHIRRDELDVPKILMILYNLSTDPFQMDETALLNIIVGAVAPDEVATEFLNAKYLGTSQKDKFLKERLGSCTVGLFETLPKFKLKTFSSMAETVKKKPCSVEKTTVLKADRELLSRLMTVAQSRVIGLKEVFKYELTSVPVSLANLDGTFKKCGNKANLMKELEKKVNCLTKLPQTDMPTCWLVDGMGLLQMIKGTIGITLGEFAKRLLHRSFKNKKKHCRWF
ncbi:hypothetical protein AOXY_G5551 [Acipenser oxyrinchus oxyrinchus]|uniref:Uncharacterized protein n=1 Tax=Acipenser oxyrinchus oxyrinchus TaxID=40147 RepID=A0AAD8GED2_ACIOX|nr:hypothetical protein AOXY_G5551 [Acipenser oxyrinchus oxyrinchus]